MTDPPPPFCPDPAHGPSDADADAGLRALAVAVMLESWYAVRQAGLVAHVLELARRYGRQTAREEADLLADAERWHRDAAVRVINALVEATGEDACTLLSVGRLSGGAPEPEAAA